MVRVRFEGFIVAALFAAPASAQGWDWSVTPYVWATGIEGDIALGPVARDVDVNFSDILDVLAGTALVQVEARNDGHVIFGDLVWLKVEPEDEVATIGGVAHAELDSTIIELGYARERERFGLELGLRYWDFEMAIDPALIAGVERSASWTDGFAGFRNTRDLGQKWALTTRANIGAGGSDLAIGLQMDFARKFANGSAFVGGLKLLDVDYEKDSGSTSFVLNTTFFGATIGYRFD